MLTRKETYEFMHDTEGQSAAVSAVSFRTEKAATRNEVDLTPIQALLSHARHANYNPQDILYRQGDECNTLHFITGGLLKLVAHLPNGRARIVRLHRPNSVLGLSSLREQKNGHTAIAITPVSALRLPISAARKLRDDDPTSYVCLLERWHDYLKDADIWIVQFSTGPIRGRVARLLAFLADFEPDATDGHVQLLTCEEMASILGVTSESVSRILADFKRQRILSHIDSVPGEFYETDAERLRCIANEGK